MSVTTVIRKRSRKNKGPVWCGRSGHAGGDRRPAILVLFFYTDFAHIDSGLRDSVNGRKLTWDLINYPIALYLQIKTNRNWAQRPLDVDHAVPLV